MPGPVAPGGLAQLYAQGAVLFQQGNFRDAAAVFARLLQQAPGSAPANNGLGLCLHAAGQTQAALERFEAAIRGDHLFAPAHINRGMALRDLGRLDEALLSFEKAVAIDPSDPTAHGNRGMLLTELGQPAAANACFDRCLAIAPDYPDASGMRLLNKAYMCDWTDLERETGDLLGRLARGERAAPPWAILAFTDSLDLKHKVAALWGRGRYAENPALDPLKPYAGHDRIRLGYYSADFHRHATTHLIAELFERHDRARFEVTAFSFGPATGDEMQKRIAAGCEHFVDVRARGDRDVAELSREMEIDIAVDLKGLTQQNRIGIFAHRAAPVQVSYLGFPGTLGVPYMDYLIADDVVIPETAKAFYSEKIVSLPGSYQVNDRKRAVSERAFTRGQAGLPETGFVFCCFNNSFKIMPGMFAVWVRILNTVPGSVLWLIEDSPVAAANLRRHASALGIDPARLVFAPRVPSDEHLARHKLADLFLDTLPYNAHTTASDSLWVGVPLVTCPGESFPARVAASLLTAVGLPELIAPTMKDYETLAVALARDTARLRALKDKLSGARATALFDTGTFARNIEAAYTAMMGSRK